MSYRYEHALVAIEDIVASLEPNGKLPSIRTLMKELNVSQVTIDRCLSKLVEQGRIRRDRGKGYYNARSAPTSRILGLYLTLRNNSLVNAQFTSGVREAAAAHGYEVADFGTRSFLERMDERLATIDQMSLSGIIVCPSSHEISSLMGDQARLERLRHLNLPIVVTQQAGGMFVDAVTTNDYQSMQRIGERLATESRGPFLFLGREGSLTLSRLHGLQAGLGPEADLRVHLICTPRLLIKDQIRALLKLAGHCTLIIGSPVDDPHELSFLTQGPWAAGTPQGLVVMLESSQVLPPGIQAHVMTKPTVQLGKAAAEVLINRLNHPNQPWQHRVVNSTITWAKPQHEVIRSSLLAELQERE
jgi:DNA-binding LacI/PurR family transcriptional regulator